MTTGLRDIGDKCTHCGKDTSFGSGLFVNRIPSTTDEETGYMCPECNVMIATRNFLNWKHSMTVRYACVPNV